MINEKSLAGYSYVATNGLTQLCRAGVIPTTGALSPKSTSALTPCYSHSEPKREGIEVTATGALAPRTSYRAILTHFTSLQNAAASNTPRNIVDASVSHGIQSFTLTAALKHVSRYKGSATDTVQYLGGYTSYDLGIGYDFKLSGTPVRATVYGRNLSDKRYETSNGVQNVGRTVGVELLATF